MPFEPDSIPQSDSGVMDVPGVGKIRFKDMRPEDENALRTKFGLPPRQSGFVPDAPEKPGIMDRLATGAKNDIQNIFRLVTPSADEEPKSFLKEPLMATRQALSRGIPFPGARTAIAYPESVSPQNKTLENLLNPLPEIITDAFTGGVKQVKKVSPDVAKLIEDSMAMAPALHGAFATPRALRTMSGETALRDVIRRQPEPTARPPAAASGFMPDAPGPFQLESPEIVARRARAADVEAAFADAERIRQSPQGAQGLAADLRAREAAATPIEMPGPKVDGFVPDVPNKIAETVLVARDAAPKSSETITPETRQRPLLETPMRQEVPRDEALLKVQGESPPSELQKILPDVPRDVYAPVAGNAPIDRIAALENEIAVLRQRIPETGETNSPTVPGLRRPQQPETPSRLQQAAPGRVDVQTLPSETSSARSVTPKPVPTPEAALSAEEIAARGEMQQMLGGKKPRAVRAPQPKLEDSEVAASTFIARQGGMDIPKNLKEEFGGWRLHKKGAMAPDEMAVEAHAAGLIPEPTTNALIDGLKSGRKSSRTGEAAGIKAQVEAAAADKIKELADTPADLEFKGKTYQGAVPEGNNLRLKDNPDIVLKKANDILSVDEKVPFDVPAEASRTDISMTKEAPRPMFEQTSAGAQSVIPGAEARSVPNAPLRPKRAQTEKPMALEMPGIEAKEPSLLGILKSERGSLPMGPLRIREGKALEAPTVDAAKKAVDDIVSSRRLIAGGLGEESSKTLSKTMGPAGDMMAKLSKAIRNDSELDASGAYQPIKAGLKKMSGAQRSNLVDVLEGRSGPIDDTVKALAGIARTELNKVADRAAEVGLQIKNPVTGEKIPFQPRENFFPHMFGKELGEIARDPKGRALLKDQIKTSLERAGKETSDAQVEQALQSMIKASRQRYGHLEIARITDFGDYSKDPGAVLSRYFSQAYRRINIAEKFGPELQEGESLLSKIGMAKGDKAESFARSYFQKVTGTDPQGNAAVRDGVTFATNFQAFSKLGQAVISNLSQPSYTAIVAGAKNAARGYGAAMTKEGRSFADKIILSDTMTDFLKDTGTHIDQSTMGKAADTVLRSTGFSAVERLNRVVSANAGKFFAEDTFAKLLKKPENATLRQTLEKMNVDVESALERGEMTEKDLLRAGQSIVNRTQFKTDVTEIPLFWASDAGRLLTQFKKFQFKSGQMVKDEILKEVAHGNVKPFIRAAAILPIAGVLTTAMKDAVRFGPQTEKERNLADYLAAVGTFGAFTDAFANSGRQPVKGLQYLAGPTLGDAGLAWEAAFIEAPKGNFKPMGKFLARQVPVVGPSIRQLFNDSKPPSEETKLLREMGIKKDRTSNKKMMKELGLN